MRLLKEKERASADERGEQHLHGDMSRHVGDPLVESAESVEDHHPIGDESPDVAECIGQGFEFLTVDIDCQIALSEVTELGLQIWHMTLLVVDEEVLGCRPESVGDLAWLHYDVKDILCDGAIEPC